MFWKKIYTDLNNERKIIFKGVGERILKRLLIYKAFLAGGGLR